MPTYEYECTQCGEVVELFQQITEPPRRRLKKTDPKPCNCNAPVRRRISAGGGLIFKGSGFYATDYRSESYKKAAKAEADAGGDGKAPAKGDSDARERGPSTEKPDRKGKSDAAAVKT